MFTLSNPRFAGGWLVLLLLVLALAGPAFASEPIQISFSAQTIKASGITEGGDAILFACTIGRYSGMQKIGRHAEVISDADGDGEVTFTVAGLPLGAVWAVVDFTTGRHAVAAPPGLDLRPMEVPAHGWRAGPGHFDLRRDYLEVLVVRPGAGAWTLSVAEGGSNDDDGALNTVVRTRLERMRRLHGPDAVPRPPIVVPRDLLLIVDPHELDFFVWEAQ
jgi:hypothetical protein